MRILSVVIFIVIFGMLLAGLIYVNIARTRAAFWVGWTNGRLDHIRLYLKEHGLDSPSPAWLEQAADEDARRLAATQKWWRLPPRMIMTQAPGQRKL